MFQKLKNKVKILKEQSLVLYYSYKNPKLSLWKKIFVGLVIGYLFSPIDLIPDFIPIIGYLDDLIIVPLGISICLKLIPKEILDESRRKVQQNEITNLPIGKKTAIFIILLWIIGIFFLVFFILKLFTH